MDAPEMIMSARKFAKIRVTLEKRDDGGLRAFSEDVPGFVLSNPDPDVVLNGIIPTLSEMLSAMWGMQVVAGDLESINDDASPANSGPTPKEYVAYPVHA